MASVDLSDLPLHILNQIREFFEISAFYQNLLAHDSMVKDRQTFILPLDFENSKSYFDNDTYEPHIASSSSQHDLSYSWNKVHSNYYTDIAVDLDYNARQQNVFHRSIVKDNKPIIDIPIDTTECNRRYDQLVAEHADQSRIKWILHHPIPDRKCEPYQVPIVHCQSAMGLDAPLDSAEMDALLSREIEINLQIDDQAKKKHEENRRYFKYQNENQN